MTGCPPRGLSRSPAAGQERAPLRAAVSAHRAARHPGEAVACPHPVCQKTVSAALAAEFDGPPAPGVQHTAGGRRMPKGP